ncbi:MAG: ABC transporter substrate-binding protein [Reyranella sp.]|uniref:ABC transporter substrate-binding protein n=1 Tax=Reyranella sp. TaxID=1929291 RepID=UPI0025FAF6F9|nr:ABC transporter substrate-binding protein [Reyranella sp.]MBR2815137.1 ABC transporter substrate-binding protein [Reyranella sp.]
MLRKRNLLAAVAALALGAVPGLAMAQQPINTNVAVYTGALVTVPTYVAKDLGIYAKHGLNVSLIDFRAAPDATAALFSGAVDLMSNSPGNMMLVNSRGRDLVAIVDNYPAPVWSVVVGKDVAMPNKAAGYPALIRDLKGKKIGVPAIGSDGHNFARRFFRDAGMNPETDATFLAVGLGPDAVAAFKVGQLDAVMAIEPVQTALETLGGKVLLDLQADKTILEFASWTSSVYHSTKSHADKNAEMMRRFQAAQEEAIAFVRDPANAEKAAAVWSKYNKALTQEQMKGVLLRLGKAFDTKFNCKGTENVGKFQVDNGLIKPDQVQTCEQLAWSGAKKYLP